jgi:hypothetical protein
VKVSFRVLDNVMIWVRARSRFRVRFWVRVRVRATAIPRMLAKGSVKYW